MIPLMQLFGIVAAVVSTDPVDFAYFEGTDKGKGEISANFSLHGECSEKGVFMSPSDGIWLVAVLADGRSLEKIAIEGIRHGTRVAIVEHPGPGFVYRMSLDRLQSDAPYDPAQPHLLSGVEFRVPGLPSRLTISYKVRCADGSLSKTRVTRGRRYPVPPYIKGSE